MEKEVQLDLFLNNDLVSKLERCKKKFHVVYYGGNLYTPYSIEESDSYNYETDEQEGFTLKEALFDVAASFKHLSDYYKERSEAYYNLRGEEVELIIRDYASSEEEDS